MQVQQAIQRGFSLVELLVALTIMSMTILIASMGFSFFMEKWDGRLEKFDTTAEMVRKVMQAKMSMSGVYGYIVRDDSDLPVIYFEGNGDSFVAVSGSPIFGEGPSVVKMEVVQQSDLLYQVVLREASLTDNPLMSATQSIRFEDSLTVLRDVSDVTFTYFGYENLQNKVTVGEPIWWSSFNALQRRILPQTIRMNFIWNGQQQFLDFQVSNTDTRSLGLFSDDF